MDPFESHPMVVIARSRYQKEDAHSTLSDAIFQHCIVPLNPLLLNNEMKRNPVFVCLLYFAFIPYKCFNL